MQLTTASTAARSLTESPTSLCQPSQSNAMSLCKLPQPQHHLPSLSVGPSAAHGRRHRHVHSSSMTVNAASTKAAAEAKPVTLVSFDVDGTLIHSIGKDANKLHKECFSAGFKEVFGLDTNIDVVEHHGSTDPLIVLKVLEHHGIPKEQALPKLAAVQEAMSAYFVSQQETRAGLGLELLPGVQKLLEALKARGDVVTCLVTGNLEPVGWGKMRALGIDHLFTQPRFGGFGSDLCSGNYEESWRDRSEFVRLAGERARQLCPGDLKHCFHVGDSPADIQAALAAGSVAVGVTTGIFSRQQLEAAAAGAGAPASNFVLLDSLEDVDAVLKVLQLQ